MNEEFLMGTPKKELNADNYKEEEEEDEDEDENNMEIMNEDHRSSLHIANYNNQGYSSSSIKNDLKKNTSGKRLKPDDEEEDVKIDTYIQRDVKSISVKDMRKLVPKLRIECFYTEQELSGKKKMKHLWDQKPPSWPVDVPFKDPNNPGKEGSTKKPGKSDLMKMYTFLREVYLKNKGLSYGSGMHSPVIQGSQQQQQQQQQQYQHVFQPESPQTYYQPQQTYSSHQQQMHQQYNLQQHYGQQCHQQLQYQPNDEMMTARKIAQPESMDDGQLIPSQIDPTLSGRTTSMSCTPSPPSNVSNGNVCQEAVKEEPFVIPSVVKDLYDRIATKVEDVTRLQGVTDAVRNQLFQVIEDVLNPIYNGLTNTSFCLMYLDAGHQMEALLDCMIVLKKVEANLLSSGCSEIKKKFQNLDVWYVNSIIPKNIPFLESSQGCVTDCIKFRSKNHQNISIPIDQRNITFETIFELDKHDKILTMQEISYPIDNSLNIFNLDKIEQMLDSPIIGNIKELLTESDIVEFCQLLEGDPNFVGENYDLQPEPTPPSQPDPIMNGHIYQANSMIGLNDHLLGNSGNPWLNSSSSCSPVESFTSYGGRGLVTGDSNHGFQNNLFRDAGLFQYGSNSLGLMSPYNNNNNNKRNGSSLISSDFVSDPGVGGNHYTPIIPKSVEDMDCCDDNNSSQQMVGRQAKRRKK